MDQAQGSAQTSLPDPPAAIGLTEAEATRRLAQYGENALVEHRVGVLDRLAHFFCESIPWMIEAAAATGMKTYFGKTVHMVEAAKKLSHCQRAVLRNGNFLIMVTVDPVLVIKIATSRLLEHRAAYHIHHLSCVGGYVAGQR